MTDRIVNPEKADELKRALEGQPQCGEDFCDTCGDCLVCDSDGCVVNGQWVEGEPHIWVVYDAYLDGTNKDYMRIF
jgi:hypothetical protein